jgi:ribosomal protein S18 acetylase RimI-like enzyme
MSIRLFKLPEDLDNLYTLITDAFQYPENPEWNADADEAEGLKTAIQTFKRIWPLFRLINWMSPAMRDALLGYIWEEDGKPVGLVTVSRRGTTDSWMIGNVAVLPEYRRRGIAHKLVQAALEFIRERGGNMAALDVIAENLPAYKLYESLGFAHYSSLMELDLKSEKIPSRPSIPDGYVYEKIPMNEWRLSMEMAKRVTPEQVQAFEPIVKGRYYVAPVLVLFSNVLNKMRCVKVEDFALRDAKTNEVAALGFTTAQTRPGGKHNISMSLKLEHADLVPFLIQFMLHKVKSHSESHGVQTSLWEWRYFALDEHMKAGFEKRKEGRRMGLALT